MGKKKNKGKGSKSSDDATQQSSKLASGGSEQGTSGTQQQEGGPSKQQQQDRGRGPSQEKQVKQGGPQQQVKQGGPPQQVRDGGHSQQQHEQGDPSQQQQQKRGGSPRKEYKQTEPQQQYAQAPQKRVKQSGPQQQVKQGGPPQQVREGSHSQQQYEQGDPSQQQQRGGSPRKEYKQTGPQQQYAQGVPPQQQRQGVPPQQRQQYRQDVPSQQQHRQDVTPQQTYGQAYAVPQQQQYEQAGFPQLAQQQVKPGGTTQKQKQGGRGKGPYVQKGVQPIGGQEGSQYQPRQYQSKAGSERGISEETELIQKLSLDTQVTAKQVPQPSPSRPKGPAQKQRQRDDKAGGDMSPTKPVTQEVSKIGAAGDKTVATYHSVLKLNRTLGKRGRKIIIETNHLELSLGKLDTAVLYDVVIEPDRPKKFFYTIMEAFRKKKYPKFHPAYDGNKILYSTQLLGPKEARITDEVTIKEDDRDKIYKVTIKFASFISLIELRQFFTNVTGNQNMPSMSALQCVDVVLRQAPMQAMIKVGRSFFTPPPRQTIIDLGDGMEMYNGFFQSAILGWKPFLNVDVSHKAFPKCVSVINLIKELYRDVSSPLRDTRTLEKFLRNLKVEYQIPNHTASKRNYRVNGLGQPANNNRFKLDNGTMMTVSDYYRTQKNYNLQYPHLPCLWVGSKTREQKIYIPCELCTVLQGQVVNTKMTEEQTRNMIKHSATDTTRRKEKIMQSARGANFNSSESVREFGFSVSNNFAKVEARVLEPPKLQYKQTAMPSRGVWRIMQFLEGVTLRKWTILNLSRINESALGKLEGMFMDNSKSLNVSCAPPTRPFANLSNYRRIDELINYFKGVLGYELIIVVIPDFGRAYSDVKKAAELRVGMLTQCLKARTVLRLNPSTIQNILLKVNAKLKGTNHTFVRRPKCMNRPCMLMGADVTHPGPDSNEPSVAAVIASHDPKAFKYNLCWRLQPSRQEIITDLEAITMEQLKFFYQQTNVKPEHLVYIRDGVSDGQFEEVLDTEMIAIRNACSKLQSTYKPPITFIVVQKRHHTRFFPMRREDSEDKNFNVPAGTCVDTTITHPRAQDFYLVSHASIQGVAKPTKYRVLWDDMDIDEDELEELMYYLCHIFARCARSVSYPAPTYYAHLAAARAKVYCEDERIDMNRLSIAQQNLTIKNEIVKGLPMFFV